MTSKAEKTTAFIIEKVAPVFNKRGYVGTSLSDITKATGLTKGAIYGNFESKEHLAVEAFNYNIRKAVGSIAYGINKHESATAKFKAFTDYYRKYYDRTLEFGGCPILNVGVDSNNHNPLLKMRVNKVINKLQQHIADIIRLGIQQGEFKGNVDSESMGLKLFSIIEGSIFTAVMLNDGMHLANMMDVVDSIIKNEILK
ncbi:MAG: TetR/AcrR family transcriptional regulator [Flavobacteriales bacterium]|nr:TetR/AcrR family transcriptional regulator [Flavobacteriales bacterium]